jgi:mannose-6-phosphate isomerase-like protein (cupin superfamily)
MDTMEQGATYLPAGEGTSLWLLGQLFTFKVRGESEAVGIFELISPPQAGAPPHLHRTQDETHYILEGQYEFVCAGRTIKAGPGALVYVPRGAVHAFTNVGTGPGRILFIEAPAGPLERWLEEVGEPVTDKSAPPPASPPDMQKLLASAERTGGIEFVQEGQVGY